MSSRVWGYRYWILAIVWGLYLVNYLDRIAVLTCLPYIQKDLNLTVQEVGWLGSIFFLFYACAQPIAGFIADKIGAKRTMAVAIIVFTFFTFITGFVRSFGQFIALRAGLALGEGQHYVPALKMISNWFPNKEKGIATSLFATTWLLAPAICPLLVSFMLVTFFEGSWRPVFFFLCVPGLLGVLILLKYSSDMPDTMLAKGYLTKEEHQYIESSMGDAASYENTKYNLGVFLKDFRFYFICLLWFLQQAMFWGMTNWISMFLVRQHNFSITQMGIYASLPYVFAVVASIVGGYLLDNVFRQQIRGLCISAYIGCTVIMLLLGRLEAGNNGVLMLLLILSGICINIVWPCLQSYPLRRYPRQVIGRVMGIVNGIAYLGAFLSPVIAGYLVNVLPSGKYDFANVFIFWSILAVFCGLAVLFLKEAPRDPKPYEIKVIGQQPVSGSN